MLSLIFIVSEKCHHIHDTYAHDEKPRGQLPAAWWGHSQRASPFLQQLKDSAGGRQGPMGQVMQGTAWWVRGLVRRDRDPMEPRKGTRIALRSPECDLATHFVTVHLTIRELFFNSQCPLAPSVILRVFFAIIV